MGLEFNALQDQLVQMRREINALKRFAPSGVVVDDGLTVATVGGTNVAFDGPLGTVRASVLRVNQWADVQFTGFVSGIAGISGNMVLGFPWPVVGAHPAQYTPVGWFDFSNPGGTRYQGTIYVYGNVLLTNNVTMWYDVTGTQTQLSTTAPAAWQVSATLRGNARVRIAPGF